GATLRDYATPDGGRGSMQHEFRVYGRGGEPCERCGTRIFSIGVPHRSRLDAARVQGLRTRRRAVRTVRNADREGPGRRTRHVVLPALPTARAGRAGSGREPLVEAPVSLEQPELAVAADRLVVDEDLRNGPAAGPIEEPLAERGVVVQRDLVV